MRHVLNDPDPGVAVRLEVGDALEVRLRQIAGAGYLWHVDSVPGVLSLDSDEVDGPGTSTAGAASRRTFGFAAVAEGRGTLELRLARPWEDHPERLLRLTVTVTA